MSEMSERIRTLEEALKTSHRLTTSASAHPLLTDDLMKIKESHPENADTSTRDTTPQSTLGKDDIGTGEIENAFGSLSVSQSGQTKYFGHAANSWVRILFYFLRIAHRAELLVQWFMHVRRLAPTLPAVILSL